MNKRIIALACLAVGLVMIVSSCTVTVNNPKPTMGYVKFLNTCSVSVLGLTVQYQVQNISGLGQAWPSAVAYGNYSLLKEVTPHSGPFTITGDIQPAGGSVTSGSWDFSNTINAGDTVTLTLTLN